MTKTKVTFTQFHECNMGVSVDMQELHRLWKKKGHQESTSWNECKLFRGIQHFVHNFCCGVWERAYTKETNSKWEKFAMKLGIDISRLEEGSGVKPCLEVSWALECRRQCWWGNEHHFSQPAFEFN